MGIRELYLEEQKKSSSTTSKKSSTGVRALYEREKEREKMSGEIDKYFEDVQSYFKWTAEDYNSYSYDNAAAGRSKIDYYTNDLRTRGNEIRTWLDANKDTLDAKSYADIIASLDSIGSGLDSIYGEYDKKLNYISGFNSAEEYNNLPYNPQVQKAAQEYLQNALSDGSLYKNQQGAEGWNKYLEDNKANMEAAISAQKKKSFWEKAGDVILEAAQMSAQSGDSNIPMQGMMNAQINAYRNDVSYMRPQDDWSKVQQYEFGRLYLESPEKAYAYAEETNKKNAQAKEEAARKEIQDNATSGGWAEVGNTIGAIATAPLGMADFLDDIAKISAGREITPDGNISPFEYSQAVTEGISTHLNEKGGVINENVPIIGGKGWGDVYGLGTSIAQSMASAYTLGPYGTLVSYFGQGAAAGVDDALSRGASEDQALLYGTLLGTFEGVAEMIGIENLFKLGSASTIKGVIKNILKQAGVEGTEEGLTTVLNNIADAWVMQDKSNFNALVEQYMAQGMSESEAQWKVFWDSIEGILYDAAGGAVSGGVSGGIHTGFNAIGNKIEQNAAIKEHGQAILDNGGQDALMQLAREKADADKKLTRLTDKAEAKPTASRIGKLSAYMEQSNAKANRDTFQRAFEQQGLSKKDAERATAYVVDELSPEESAKLENNKTVMDAVDAVIENPNLNIGADTIKLAQARANVKTDLQNETNGDIIDTESEVIANESDESTESVRLRDSSERLGGTNTERQISRVESGTGSLAQRRQTLEGKPRDRQASRLVDEGREVSVASLGVSKGSNIHKVRLLDIAPENEIDSMKAARKEAEARGLIIKFFAGGNLVIEENTEANVGKADKDKTYFEANGYINGKVMLVRVDHYKFTADQIARHEIGHDMIAEGEVDINAVREKLVEIVGDKERIDEIASLYAQAYAKTGLNENEIWEECICDSLGDMNIFGYDKEAAELMKQAIPDIQKAVKETAKAPNQTRGSPEGKTSRVTQTKYLSYNALGMNVVSHIKQELKSFYGDVDNAIADGIAVEYGNKVYITDSSKENGVLKVGIHKDIVYEIDDAQSRKDLIKEINDDQISNEQVSDGLLEKFGHKRSDNGSSNRQRSLGEELQSDIGKPQDNQRRVSRDNANRRDSIEEIDDVVANLKEVHGFTDPVKAKDSGKVNDAHFSIEFADNIANNQRKYVADGLSRISSEELEKAIADTAHMVNEMKPYANILPQDKVGKTLVKNGSYDVSVENTTVCIRTLAYNSFVDMVSERVGRPLTQMESFLVSQKLYEIAKEPQCLYCYVSLDRKAFNEMVIRYTEQRDAAIKAYEEAGKPKIPGEMNAEWKLFKDFLDGRKPTKNMWDRYVGWLKAYNNGERLVSLSDISTEAKRLELVESGGEVASQVKDILKYAQSASWAKKQTQYVAYYDEILKLKPAVIRNLNSHYGMRWYSFSDYSGAFIVENMQQITDAAIRGLKGLSYTKDTDFAEIFAPTGMNINISVYATKTANGYEIDAKQSANIDEAIKLREKYPNVGIVVVATDKGGVEWALAQEWSDVVIPFHTVRTGADVAEFYNWEIFNAEQNDTVTDQNLWDEYVKGVGKKKVSKMVYPSEHQNNLDTYLEICKERGLTPRFKSFLDNPNYMKLVNETRQSESETKPLKPKFDVEAAERSFDKFVEKGGYYEGWYNDGIDVDSEAEIVASDVRAGKKANEVDYGRQDVDFETLKKSRKDNRTHGKASRELDLITYMDEEAIREGREMDEGKAPTDRERLANALESITENEIEKNKLAEYKAKIEKMNAETEKLAKLKAEIKELTFGKGEKNPEKLKNLRSEATKTENRINIYDKQLLNLEATTALKNVLQREKQKAYKRAAEKGREALRRNVEGRNKTAMRHKIQDVASRLDKLLNRGTKERNVKTEMSGFVRTALEMTDMLFATDDELIMNGIVSEARENEKQAIARFEALYEEYHSYDDSVTENKERRAELRSEMNEVRKELSELLNAERARINNAKASDIFDKLVKEIKNFSKSQNEYISHAFDKDKMEFIEDLASKVGNTLVKDMTLDQLETVYKALRVVETTVQNSNKLFGHKDDETVDKLGAAAVREIKAHGEKKLITEFGKGLSNMIGWNNLKPIYLAERLGSTTLQRLMGDVLKAESDWATYVAEAEKYVAETKKKHGYDKWDFKKKWEFSTGTGLTYELDLGLMMTLYAYAKRGESATNHLRNDGFAFDKLKVKKGVITYELNDSTAYKVTDAVMLEIGKILTDKQKAFVDDMQAYLSDTLGARGNKVSEQLVGIPLFNETNYLPIRSESAYLERKRLKDEGSAKIKNRGFTKPTQENARNAVVLSDFLTLCTEHIVEMNEYAAFTLPLENFYKVYNWQNKSGENTNKVGVIPALENAYGKGTAVKAVDELLKDLNGGAKGDYREGVANKAIAAFKKAKVMFSFSVVIQQPSSILRAQAMIDPIYFVGKKYNKDGHKAQWEELKKYAPVAVIKEMGYFDIGMGQTAAQWISGEKTLRDRVDEITSWGAAKADEVTWIAIWNAVKRETLHNNPKMNPRSEAFLQLAGARFEDIIRHTQVYDSTLARSANMRSKSTYMKMLTSFMAEPTTSLNMREMALRSKNKGRIARTTAAVYASFLLNAFLVAIPYAMRDDDEDETWWEKYFSALESSFVDNINPINSLPIFKDIWSLSVGYDVERSDMSLASDLMDSFMGITKAAYNKDKDKLASSIFDGVGDLANLTGSPLKNLVREVEAIVNFAKTIDKDINDRDMSWNSFSDEIVETLKNEIPVWGWLPDKKKTDKIYESIMEGDEKYLDRLESSFKDYDSYVSAVRKALRENDPRIHDAAIADIEGDVDEYDRIVEDILGEGKFTEEDIKSAINSEINFLTDEEDTESEPKKKSIYEPRHFYSAVNNGNTSLADKIREDIVATHEANGKSREEAEEAFESSFKGYLSDLYKEDSISTTEATEMLVDYCGRDEDEAYWDIRRWDYVKANGSDEGYSMYNEFNEAVRTGKNLKAVIKEYTSHGKDNKTLGDQITSYYKPLYKEMTNRERANIKGYLLNAYVLLGYDRSKKMKDIDKWLED